MASESEIKRIRRLINDNDEPYEYTDDEIGNRFTEDGSNFNLLAYHIWIEKASQFSTAVNTSESGSSRSNGDLYKNALEQARFFKGLLDDENIVIPPSEVAPFVIQSERT